MFPGLYFATAAMLKAYAGVELFFVPLGFMLDSPYWRDAFNLFSPLVFLGGPLLALVINVLRLVRLDVYRDGNGVRGTFSVGLRRANALVAGTALGVGMLLLAYAVVENLG